MEEETCEKPKCNNNSLLTNQLKNNEGFGVIGLILVVLAFGLMAAMYLPTQTAKNEYYQARYISGVTKTIENAENAYMAKNSSFADLVTLSQNGYLSPQFLQSLQPASNPGGPYPQPNWITLTLANQTVNLCIDNAGGCPDNPSGNNYFIGLYSVPVNYANYIEHELPGSGIGSQGGGLDYVAYSAPVPSAPPVVVPDNGATPAAKYTQTWLNPGFYTWTVPSGVTVIGVSLAGGTGYSNNFIGNYGDALYNQLFNVSPGGTLSIYVGQNGSVYYGGWGYGSGGNGGSSPGGSAGGGGGSSAVVGNGQIIMAPGGGGYSGLFYIGNGGHWYASGGGGGGYTNGGNGVSACGYPVCTYPGGNGGWGGGIGGLGNPNGSTGGGAPSGLIPFGNSFVEIQWN